MSNFKPKLKFRAISPINKEATKPPLPRAKSYLPPQTASQLNKPSGEFKSCLLLFPSPAEPLQPTFGEMTRLSFNSVLRFPGHAQTCSPKAQFHSNQEKGQVLSCVMGLEKHAYCVHKCTDSCKSEVYTKENSPMKREKNRLISGAKKMTFHSPPPKMCKAVGK